EGHKAGLGARNFVLGVQQSGARRQSLRRTGPEVDHVVLLSAFAAEDQREEQILGVGGVPRGGVVLPVERKPAGGRRGKRGVDGAAGGDELVQTESEEGIAGAVAGGVAGL